MQPQGNCVQDLHPGADLSGPIPSPAIAAILVTLSLAALYKGESDIRDVGYEEEREQQH